MIHKVAVTKNVTIDMVKFLDLAANTFEKNYLLESDKKAFRFAVNHLKHIVWDEWGKDSIECLDVIMELELHSAYRKLCNKCPHLKPDKSGNECLHYAECGAGEVLDDFYAYIKENVDELIEESEV